MRTSQLSLPSTNEAVRIFNSNAFMRLLFVGGHPRKASFKEKTFENLLFYYNFLHSVCLKTLRRIVRTLVIAYSIFFIAFVSLSCGRESLLLIIFLYENSHL